MKTEAIRKCIDTFAANVCVGDPTMIPAKARAQLEEMAETAEILAGQASCDRSQILKLEAENARLIEACCDARLSLGQSFDSMEKCDLLAIIGEAERIIEAVLSGKAVNVDTTLREENTGLREALNFVSAHLTNDPLAAHERIKAALKAKP